MTVEQQLALWADELRSIANEGLRWSDDNPYQVHRFERVLRIAAALFSLTDTRDVAEIEHAYHADLGHVAPYPVADAAVFDGENRILLIRRADNGLWAMPGGALEVGETPAEGACREAWEETGVAVEALNLSGVYDSRFLEARSPFHLYMFVFLCRPLDAAQQPQVTNETLDVGWYAEDELSNVALDPGHVQRIADAFDCWLGRTIEPAFDR